MRIVYLPDRILVELVLLFSLIRCEAVIGTFPLKLLQIFSTIAYGIVINFIDLCMIFFSVPGFVCTIKIRM